MKVLMRGNKIGVQRLGKSSKKDSFIALPESGDSLGVIRYVGIGAPEDLKVGMKVYYGKNRQFVRMGDADIEVMEEDNVFAIVEEKLDEEKSQEITV